MPAERRTFSDGPSSGGWNLHRSADNARGEACFLRHPRGGSLRVYLQRLTMPAERPAFSDISDWEYGAAHIGLTMPAERPAFSDDSLRARQPRVDLPDNARGEACFLRPDRGPLSLAEVGS